VPVTLYLWVSPDEQVRRWLFRLTSPVTHQVTEAGLDMVAHVSLAQAKAKAQAMRQQIAAGICPIHVKRAERASAVTFKEACDGWIDTHRTAWKGGDEGSQMRNAKVLLHHHSKALLNKPVSEVTPDHVQAALKDLWSKYPLQGRRALGMIERVLDYARAKGMRTGDNPASWRGMHEYRYARARKVEQAHYAALSYEEMPSFMKALRLRQQERKGTGGLALEFEKRLWTIPAHRMKAGKEHEVPLCARAIEILELQKQYANDSGYVFTGHKRGRLADKSMASVLFYMKVKTSVHGFRSTFRDWAGDQTSFPREHIEACLAHRVGNRACTHKRLVCFKART
jgi:integrase